MGGLGSHMVDLRDLTASRCVGVGAGSALARCLGRLEESCAFQPGIIKGGTLPLHASIPFSLPC
jgi:hypothetical protein